MSAMFGLKHQEGPKRERDCVIAVVERDGRVLLGMKAPGAEPYPDTWRLPGGGIEPGESNREALKRELKEETGLELVSAEPVLYQEDLAKKHGELWKWRLFNYTVEARGEPRPGGDLVKLEWVPKAALADRPLTPMGAKLFQHLGWLK